MASKRQIITHYYDETILTSDMLENYFTEKDIIAEGYGIYPEIHATIRIHWIAVKGLAYDWAIYYLQDYQHPELIMANGDKMLTKSLISRLVPCSNDVLSKYRFL